MHCSISEDKSTNRFEPLSNEEESDNMSDIFLSDNNLM